VQLHLKLCQAITEQGQQKRRRKRKALKSSYLPGNNALSKASQSLSSTVLSVFLTIARIISNASFLIADPLRKAKRIGSRIFSMI